MFPTASETNHTIRPFIIFISVNAHLTLYQTTEFWTWPNWKKIADDRINEAKMMIFVFDRVENIVGKGENAGNHFPLFQPKSIN